MSKMHSAAQDKCRQGTGKKGLTREEAKKAYPHKAAMGDCRAFSYDPKTGKWCYT